MPSSVVRNPVRLGDDFKARQKLKLDRLRTAIAIVERMRQAGICCELYNDVKTATDRASNKRTLMNGSGISAKCQ